MAVNDTSKLNILFKKIFGKSATSDANEFFEESIDARQAVYSNQVWNQFDDIPTTAPVLADQAISGVVQYWEDLVLTAVPGAPNAFYSANLKDAIPFNFGDGSYNYEVKDSTSAPIAFGLGDWVVDTDTGTLWFTGTLPANMPPSISFYKYVGTKGVGSGSGGGGGGVNFIEGSSANFEEDIGDWETVSFRRPITGGDTGLDLLNLTGEIPTGTLARYLQGSTPVGGLTNGNDYYITNLGGGDYQVRSTPTGSPVDITSLGDGFMIPYTPVGDETQPTGIEDVVEITQDTSVFLNGLASGLFTKKDTENGQGFAFRLTVPIPLGYREDIAMLLSFVKGVTGTNNLADGSYKLFVKETGTDNLIYVQNETTDIASNADPFMGFVRIDVDSVDVIIHIISNSTSVMFLRVDDFTLAPANFANVPVDQSITFNFSTSASNNFTSGSISFYKIGRSVIWYISSSIGHASSASPTSAVGLVPEWARPSGAFASNVYNVDGTSLYRLLVSDAGTITINYKNTSFADLARTASSTGSGSYLANTSAGSVSALISNSNLEILKTESAIKTPAGSGQFHNLSGANLVLKAGRTYEVWASGIFGQSGAAGYSDELLLISGANGADSASAPTLLNTISTVQILTQPDVWGASSARGVATLGANNTINTPKTIVRALQDTTVYAVTYAVMSTPGNARITVQLNAQEIPFSNTALISGMVYLGQRTITTSQANVTFTADVYRSGRMITLDLVSNVAGVLSGAVNITTSLLTEFPVAYTFSGSQYYYDVGELTLRDTGTTSVSGSAVFTSATTLEIRANGAAGTYATKDAALSGTVPFTWASGDSITGKISYPVVGW